MTMMARAVAVVEEAIVADLEALGCVKGGLDIVEEHLYQYHVHLT